MDNCTALQTYKTLLQLTLQALERERMRTDAVLSNWRTPPSSPWEPSEDATFDTSSLSWDTEDITPQEEATVPERWDEREEETEASQTSTSEIWTTAGEEDEDSLPELVSGSEDSCLLYTSPSPRDRQKSRMPSSA